MSTVEHGSSPHAVRGCDVCLSWHWSLRGDYSAVLRFTLLYMYYVTLL